MKGSRVLPHWCGLLGKFAVHSDNQRILSEEGFKQNCHPRTESQIDIIPKDRRIPPGRIGNVRRECAMPVPFDQFKIERRDDLEQGTGKLA
jgi:hypothetical protein